MRLVFACVFSLFLVFVVSDDSLLLQQTVENLKENLQTTFGCSGTVGDNNYDITSLYSSTVDYSAPDSKNAYTYYLNPCGVAHNNPTGGKCAIGFATFCQVGTGTSANLGTCTVPPGGTQPAAPTWRFINSANPGLGVQVVYSNGDGCSATPPPTPTKIGIVNFVCDPTQTGRGRANGTVSESPTCTFAITILTDVVCPGGAGGPPPSRGLSGGSVFLIILVVLLFVYIVAGIIYQRKKKGATGAESCPNIEFWRGLPGLVKEGFHFTWTKLRGLCGKGEYTEVK